MWEQLIKLRFISLMQVLLILARFLFQTTSASVFYKCPDSIISEDSLSTIDGDEGNGGKHWTYIRVPGEIMSNFAETEFRLESTNSFSCDLSDAVIKINLIGSSEENMNINFITLQTASSSIGEPTDSPQGSLTRKPNSTFIYKSFPQQVNGSNSEDFMIPIGNNTLIRPDTRYSTENGGGGGEQECDRKLNKREIHFTPSGFLFYSGQYYRSTEYCIQSFKEDERSVGVRMCNINCDKEGPNPCIPLCCHLHEYVDLELQCCQATLESKPMFQPVIYSGVNLPSLVDLIDSDGLFSPGKSRYYANKGNESDGGHVTPHYVEFKYLAACPDGMEPLTLFFNEEGESNMNTRIHVQDTGKVAYLGVDRHWHFLENFCIAGIVNHEHNEETSKMSTILLYCLDSEDEAPSGSSWQNYVYIAAFCLSSIFLMLTVIVYILLWDKQNIHGWTVLSFVTSEFLLFLILAFSYSIGVFVVDLDDTASKNVYCIGAGILAHFFFLSTFCWLTIINLDLWWTFKSLTPLSERSKGKKRFCMYMSFAWGVPTLIIAIGLILQHIYEHRHSFVLVPDYGTTRCFLAPHAEGVYLYYIIGALLLANFFLISCTFVTIYRFKKSTRVASSSSSKSKERSFKLFVRLVLVMGVTWSLEFILWLEPPQKAISWLQCAADLFNIFQSIATFMIFVCKRKILNQLEQKHPALRVITKPLLKLMAARSSAFGTSTDSKPTQSTTVRSSSILQGSRRTMQSVNRSSVADSKL